ncbi:hypothetical protein BDY24DRAFT_416305 [Mrakia frigida]|uniref:zinc finger MYND domain-containing protein n=1 Tax=Mrakia frigida TaxID=29902 RepID=UPI003FCBF28E
MRLVRSGRQQWRFCEWATERSRTSSTTPVTCESGEMNACGRCLLVRYCSEKHQKHHWKEHKKLCFKSSW